MGRADLDKGGSKGRVTVAREGKKEGRGEGIKDVTCTMRQEREKSEKISKG